MTSPRSRTHTAPNGVDDAVSALQATLEREEDRRAKRTRAGVIAIAFAVAASIGVAALVLDRASAKDNLPAIVSVGEPAVIESATASASPSVSPDVDAAQTGESTNASTSSLAKTPAEPTPPVETPAVTKPIVQRFLIAIGSNGYEPGVVLASTDKPIELKVEQGEGCAAGFLIPALGVDRDNSRGPITVSLGTVPAGRYQFSCGMEMVTGTLIVE